jgi:bacterioferritin
VPPAEYRALPREPASRVIVAAPGPYPEAAVSSPSTAYAALLLEDYAGRASELTAVHQYVYHHLVTPEGYGWLGQLFEDVAAVEMRHLELLGETIRLLGADPRFFGQDGRHWDSGAVAYQDALRAQLTADVEAEAGAIAQYERHYALIADPWIRQLLARIIADEQLHLFLFRWASNYVP